MLALALLVLSTAPSASALVSDGRARGMLVRVAAATALPPEDMPLAQMSREQLRAQYRYLDENRPGIAGQIVATSMGGACIGAGVITLYGSLILGIAARVPIVGLAIGLGLLVGGGGLLTFGIIMLKLALRERAPYGEQMDEIQQRLDGTWDPRDDTHAPMNVPPPPPPPPPPTVELGQLAPMVVVARF